MAVARITELNNNNTIDDADIVVIVDDVAGSPVTEKRTVGELKAHIGSGNVSKVGTPADNQVGVWTGDGTIEGDANLTWNGAGTLAIESDSAGTSGVGVELFHNSATPATGADASYIEFYGNNSNAAKTSQGAIRSGWSSITAGAERGFTVLSITENGSTWQDRLTIRGDINGALLGDGVSAGVVASYGNKDLILQTGNATTGKITITDGADGNITLSPNGSGDVVAVGTVLSLRDGTYTNYVDAYVQPTYVATYAEDGSSGSAVSYRAEDGNTNLSLEDTGTGAAGPLVELYHNSASPAANDVVGKVDFYGEDSAGNKQQYAGIQGIITDPTSTSEDGSLQFNVIVAGSETTRLTADASGVTTTGQLTYPTAVSTPIALGNLGATETINWASGTHFTGTLDADVAITHSNEVSGQKITLVLSYSGAQRTITWSDVDAWAGGTAPTAPSTGETLVVTLAYIGTTCYGAGELFS